MCDAALLPTTLSVEYWLSVAFPFELMVIFTCTCDPAKTDELSVVQELPASVNPENPIPAGELTDTLSVPTVLTSGNDCTLKVFYKTHNPIEITVVPSTLEDLNSKLASVLNIAEYFDIRVLVTDTYVPLTSLDQLNPYSTIQIQLH